MRISIDPSVTPAQRSDPHFLRLRYQHEVFFSSPESRKYKILLGLHEVGHGYFARKSGATDVQYYGPCMTWDSNPKYNCPSISRSSCGWTPNPNASVVAQMKAHIGGFVCRRELSDEPNDGIAIERDLQGAREFFFDKHGTGNAQADEEAFQRAIAEAEHELLEDLKDPNIVTEIWSEARRFVKEVFPTPKTIKVGRNSPCSCGSGKKFKRCCIDRIDRINRTDRLVPELVAT